MTANALVQARIDRAVKEEATIVLSAMGLTVSDAVRLMLTKIAREHTLLVVETCHQQPPLSNFWMP